MTDTRARLASGDDVTVSIDEELCYGTGACARQAPHVFRVDGATVSETGKAQVRSDVAWDGVDFDTVRRAAESCPWAAIEVER